MSNQLYPDDFDALECATCDKCGETFGFEDVDGQTGVCNWCQQEMDLATFATVPDDEERDEVEAPERVA